VSRGYARLYILRPALVRAGLMGHIVRVAGPHRASPTWNATWTDRVGATHAEAFTTEASAVRAVARRHHPAPSSWHGLRHAYVSALVTAGLDPVHVAMAAGHSDSAFTCEPMRTPRRMPRPGFGPRSPTSKWTDPRVFSFVPSAFLFGDPAQQERPSPNPVGPLACGNTGRGDRI
jgi:hypothetical protein